MEKLFIAPTDIILALNPPDLLEAFISEESLPLYQLWAAQRGTADISPILGMFNMVI